MFFGINATEPGELPDRYAQRQVQAEGFTAAYLAVVLITGKFTGGKILQAFKHFLCRMPSKPNRPAAEASKMRFELIA